MDSDRFVIETRAAEPFLKNGFVLGCVRSKAATVIDPGDEAGELLEWIDGHGYQPISITLTHAHLDHISGVSVVKDRWDVPIFLHPEDGFLYDSLQPQAAMFGLSYPPAPPRDFDLQDGQRLSVGELRLEVLHTPGHSPGSVSLVLEKHVFCGDVIFAGSIGRTDLPGGSLEILMRTIRTRLLPLGDDRILHPGHGPETTIGRERTTNPFLVGP